MPVPETQTTPSSMLATEDAYIPGRPASGEVVLSVAPGYAWAYAHYADAQGAWFVAHVAGGSDDPDAGVWWLPVLIALKAKPGLCGHRTRSPGEEDHKTFASAHQRVRDVGGKVIPLELGYCKPRACRHPITGATGRAFLDAWSTPRRKVRGKRQKYTFNRQMYYRWLLSLVRDGYVDTPPEELLDLRKAQLAERVSRREALDFSGNESLKEKVIEAASVQAGTAEDARVPAPARRVAHYAAEAPPAQSYADLQKAAKELGYKVGGKSRAVLEGYIKAGRPE